MLLLFSVFAYLGCVTSSTGLYLLRFEFDELRCRLPDSPYSGDSSALSLDTSLLVRPL